MFFNFPFPCNCIQLSLTAEAIQNSNAIPKGDPTNHAAYETSFCKLHSFALQPATTRKPRLNYEAQAAAPLLRSITSSPPAAAHGYLTLNVSLPCVRASRPGWNVELCSGRNRSLPPAGLQHRAALPCQPPWSRAPGARARQKNAPEITQVSHGSLLCSLRRLLDAQKGITKLLRWFNSKSQMHTGKTLKRLLKLQITPLWLHFQQSQH